jgi:Cytochrome c554 and c-prime
MALFCLAAWLWFWSPPADVPRAQAVVVAADLIAPGARRRPTGDPPLITVGGYTHGCRECHQFFVSPVVQNRRMVQHTHIVLNHGLNSRCFNCHSRANRERLVLYDGTTLSFGQVPRLCAQCHGTVYRDWQRGMHGKTLGSWDAASGEQVRLNCNDCHDPHAPAYKPIAPLPAPNTLRMGAQPSELDEPLTRHTPLRRWSAGQPETEPVRRPDEGVRR